MSSKACISQVQRALGTAGEGSGQEDGVCSWEMPEEQDTCLEIPEGWLAGCLPACLTGVYVPGSCCSAEYQQLNPTGPLHLAWSLKTSTLSSPCGAQELLLQSSGAQAEEESCPDLSPHQLAGHRKSSAAFSADLGP